MKQCLLSMKDMGDNNAGGNVYGFATMGESWRMLNYDVSGGLFMATNKIEVIFQTMGREKEKWMRNLSIMVDCVYAALRNGGMVWDRKMWLSDKMFYGRFIVFPLVIFNRDCTCV